MKEEWIRSSGQNLAIRIALGFGVAFATLFFILAIAAPGLDTLARVGLLLIDALFLPLTWIGFRASRAGCRPEAAGLRVRNIFSECVIPWDER